MFKYMEHTRNFWFSHALCAERAAGYSLCDGQVSRIMTGVNQSINQFNQFTFPVFWPMGSVRSSDLSY